MKKSHSILQPVAGLLALAVLGIVLLSGCGQEATVSDTSLVAKPQFEGQASTDDFVFPSRPPRLSHGKVVFEQNCAQCHTGKFTYGQVKDKRPIDTYLLLSRGDANHKPFTKLSYDERWEAAFYTRYLAGAATTQRPMAELDAVFGGNCAVCHGKKGLADGSLYTGHGPHELKMATIKNAFDPAPADFHSYSRMYNRTDDQLVKFITEGIYPSAMPSWKGRVDKAKNVTFDDAMILDLVKYVRSLSFDNDLPAASSASDAKKAPERELSARPVPAKM